MENFKRNSDGLIEGLQYVFNEDKTINWRAMVPVQYLYLNPERRNSLEQKYGKKLEEVDLATTKVDDQDLVITLGGIKFLCRLRGFSSVYNNPVVATDVYCACHCRITFIPNFETFGTEVEFSDNACAHLGNTTRFGKQYLVEMASNRAFCRCVRNFLNINIVSKEELGAKSDEEAAETDGAYGILQAAMDKKGITFEKVKEKLVAEKFENAESFSSIKDIPKKKVFDLISRINKKASEKTS